MNSEPERRLIQRELSFGRQLRALLTKNYLLKIRSRRLTLVEILMPVYFLLIIAFIRKAATTGSEQSVAGVLTQPIYPVPSLSFYADQALAYYPNTDPFAQSIATIMTQQLVPNGVNVTGFASESEFISSYFTSKGSIFGAVDLSSTSTTGSYKIKLNSTYMFNFGLNMAPSSTYINSGAMSLQYMVQNAILRTQTPTAAPLPSFTVSLQPFPQPPYTSISNPFEYLYPFYFTFAFSQFLQQFIAQVVTERSEKIREGMMMMGCSPLAYQMSWLLTQSFLGLISSILLAVLGRLLGVFQHSDPTLVACFFFLYSLSIVSFGFGLSVLFKTPKAASSAGILLLMIFVACFAAVQFALLPTNPSPIIRNLVSLVSPVPFGEAMLSLSQAELTNGLQWGMIFGATASPSAAYPVSTSFWFLIIDTVLFFFLSFYIDAVHPGEYGVGKPLLFFLSPSYWKQVFSIESSSGSSPADSEQSVSLLASSPASSSSSNSQIALQIQGLRKVYYKSFFGSLFSNQKKKHGESNETVAVRNLDLQVRRGEILALLGQNGAGKSTTIGMLSGLFPPTAGEAFILGHSIRTEMNQIRKSLGVCSQHNILFPKLTVREHLNLYAAIKGVQTSDVDREVNAALRDVDLLSLADKTAEDMSGGQKRRVSIAIAFVGKPDFVLLDEASCGLDPVARQQLWKLLQREKAGRCILLTTHSMEEADLLSDVIAIMARGKLQAFGSSLSLKTQFGLGYRLVISRLYSNDLNVAAQQVNAIQAVVEKHIPGFKLDSSQGSEIVFSLPQAASTRFPDFLEDLESLSKHLGIQSYGLEMTTLEQVFLKLMDQSDQEAAAEAEDLNNDDDPHHSHNGHDDA